MIRHAIFNQIRSVKTKFQNKFGKEIIIATEGMHCWRKDVFPYYKIKRKEQRNTLPLPWEDVMAVIRSTQKDIQENFPYYVLNHDKAEGDDIIASIAKEKARNKEPVLIVSSDKDFAQLQIFPTIQQYSIYHENYLIDQDPVVNRNKKILTGDSDDSVPNILSDDDVFTIKGKRQPPMTQPRIKALLENIPENLLANYERNVKLVDLIDGIPKSIESEIVNQYRDYVPAKGRVYNYFVAHGLNHHTENAQDFI